MDTCSMQILSQIGISLTELAIKGTATAVANKVKAIQDEKSIEKIRNTYDEIINELLAERDEAVRIAQAYKSELDRISISDEDIIHLNETATRLLDVIKAYSPNSDIQTMETIKNLISSDTLKTMQLIGFNYKAAIGEPLTNLCSDAIMKLGKRNSSPKKK